jgi:hypothetical protein
MMMIISQGVFSKRVGRAKVGNVRRPNALFGTAGMEMITERSIQERRERMFSKAKSTSQPDPAPQPKKSVAR